MEEIRTAQRRRTLKEGRVLLSDWTTVGCRIRDLSETGARLDFDGPIQLPAEMRLLVVSSNQVIPAALVWQRGLGAGIHFTGPARAAPARKY